MTKHLYKLGLRLGLLLFILAPAAAQVPDAQPVQEVRSSDAIPIFRGGQLRSATPGFIVGSPQHYIYPETYGARGDDVTLDAAAMQQAFNACFYLSTNGGTPYAVILNPAKSYYMSNVTLTVNGPITVLGSGTSQNSLGGGAWPNYCNFSTLRWDSMPPGQACYGLSNNFNVDIDGCLFSGITFIGPSGRTNGVVNWGTNGTAVIWAKQVTQLGQHNVFNECSFMGWSRAIVATNSDGMILNNCQTYHLTNDVIISGGYSQACEINSWRGGGYGDGIVIANGAFCTINCDEFCNNGQPGGANVGRNIVVTGSSEAVVIGANLEFGNPLIYVDGSFVECYGTVASHPAQLACPVPPITVTNGGRIKIGLSTVLGSDTNNVTVLNCNTMVDYTPPVVSEGYGLIVVTNYPIPGNTNLVGFTDTKPATAFLTVGSTGFNNTSSGSFFAVITAGTSLTLKDWLGNTIGSPTAPCSFPVKAGWQLTGTGVSGFAFSMNTQ